MSLSLADLEYYALNTVILGFASLLFYGIHKLNKTTDLGSVHSSAEGDPAALLISLALLTWMVAVVAALWMKVDPPGETTKQFVRTVLSTLNSALFLGAAMNLDQAPEWLRNKGVIWRRRVIVAAAGLAFILTLLIVSFSPEDARHWSLMVPDVVFSSCVLALFCWIVVKSVRVRTNSILWIGILAPIILLLFLQPWEVLHAYLGAADPITVWKIPMDGMKLASKIGFIFSLFLLFASYLNDLVVSLRPVPANERPSLEFITYRDPDYDAIKGHAVGKVQISIPERKVKSVVTLNGAQFRDLLTFAVASCSDVCNGGWLYNTSLLCGIAKTKIKNELSIPDINWLFETDRNGSSRLKRTPREFVITIAEEVRQHESGVHKLAEGIVVKDIKQRQLR